MVFILRKWREFCWPITELCNANALLFDTQTKTALSLVCHIVPLFFSDTEISKLNEQKITELGNGSIELKELLSGNTAASDDEDEEFELNVHTKR